MGMGKKERGGEQVGEGGKRVREGWRREGEKDDENVNE